jgi:hypothetical protein
MTTMPTAEDALVEARRWLDAGTAELPGEPRNRVPGITDWTGYLGAWCDAFQMRVQSNIGMPIGPGPKGSMWVSTTMAWYAEQGRNFTDPHQARPGDLVAFEWGWTAGGYDHIGLVEEVRPDGLVCIEGNVRDRVQRLWRHWATAGFAEFARPAYATAPVIFPARAPRPRRDRTMHQFTNLLGLQEWATLNDQGHLINKWEQPDRVELSSWSRPLGEFVFSSLGDFTSVGPQIWAPGSAAQVFGQAHVTVVISMARNGQSWSVHETDDLRALFAGHASGRGRGRRPTR